MKKKNTLITGIGKGKAIGLVKMRYKVITATHTWEQMSRFIEEIKDSEYKINIVIN